MPINVIVQAPSAVPPAAPVGLQANVLPEPPDSDAGKIFRIYQLKLIISEAKNLKERMEKASEIYEKSSQQFFAHTGGRITSASIERSSSYETWTNGVRQLKEINGKAYRNRRMDLETIPELTNPLLKAPGEDAFGDNATAAYNFRTFHFLSVNVAKQIDALVEELERDLGKLTGTIRNAPFAKIVLEDEQKKNKNDVTIYCCNTLRGLNQTCR